MVYEVIGITVLWIFLFGYIIVASIDFGAGFFSLHAKLFGQSHEINDLIQRYLNPVWEVTNVFFVFFFVGIVGFFPDTAYYYGTVLLIPGSIALILLSIRGAFYAFENYGQDSKLSWLMLYAVSGLLIPASLSTALTISEGGYIIESSSGNVDLNWTELLLSPFGWAVVLLAIVSVLYISSGFLTFYAHRAKDTSAYQLMRKWFLMWGAPMIMMSLFVFLSLRIQNEAHFMSAVFDYGWLFIISFIAFAIAGVLTLLKKAHGIAFIFVIIQMG
ncbi:cytochrome d ubiquinol oxidase subunit II, partial [Staphylococcus pseudintermedius]|nr:cytochrome d ubiquinol oxidase subunit II [Staphylococcus pseudintermedius]